jgi:adenosylhomocysteine nucleosidase
VAQRTVVIFVAIQIEADAIARSLGLAFDAPRTRATGVVDENVSVDLRIIGIRGGQLPAHLDDKDIRLIISAGLAGGLDPSLRCGDVVIDGDAPSITGAKQGRIHHTDTIVATPAQKRELFQQTGAIAVDMETAHIRQLAERCGIPCIAIRAISDEAVETIDPSILGLVDSMGRPKPAAIMKTLCSRPWLMPQLMRLKSRSNIALSKLCNVLRQVLHARATEL